MRLIFAVFVFFFLITNSALAEQADESGEQEGDEKRTRRF